MFFDEFKFDLSNTKNLKLFVEAILISSSIDEINDFLLAGRFKFATEPFIEEAFRLANLRLTTEEDFSSLVKGDLLYSIKLSIQKALIYINNGDFIFLISEYNNEYYFLSFSSDHSHKLVFIHKASDITSLYYQGNCIAYINTFEKKSK